MKAKLSRGPMKNKYIEVRDGQNIIVIHDSVDTRAWSSLPDPLAEVKIKRGTYQRSNVTLKNGAVVFEWMGWI